MGSPGPAGGAVRGNVVPAVGGDPARLAGLLTSAEKVLGEGAASPVALARPALIVQLACLRLAGHPGWGDLVIARVAQATAPPGTPRQPGAAIEPAHTARRGLAWDHAVRG